MIFEKTKGYVHARSIELNDELNILLKSNQSSFFSKVTRINLIIENGLTAPLTESGTIIVNGIHASCYAVCDSHSHAHIAMKPLVYWYKLRQFFSTFELNSNPIHDLILINFSEILC